MKYLSRSHRWSCGLLCLQLAVGCATQSKEPGRAVASPPSAESPSAEAVKAEARSPQPNMELQAPLADDSRNAPTVAPAREAVASGAATPALNATKKDRKATSEADSERRRGAAGAPKSKLGISDKPAAAPEPTLAFAEPPELRAAVLEFDAQWEKLSTSRACEDACRAYESMRRAAQRICDLVVSSDPGQRCRTARSRLDQASRDLASRCADCR
jgi:hypothetical protein